VSLLPRRTPAPGSAPSRPCMCSSRWARACRSTFDARFTA